MRLQIWTLLLLPVFVLALLGCGSREEAAGPTELVFLAMGGDDAQGNTFEELAEKFSEDEPNVTVTYQRVPSGWPEYTQKVVAQIAAGSPPNVINLSPLNKVDFVDNDYLLDLNPLIESSGMDRSEWYPPTFDAWQDEQGRQFGIGHGIYTEAIYYNKDLFREAGLELPSTEWDQSWSWEEMARYARALTRGEGAEKQYGFFVEPQLGWLTPVFHSFCGSVGLPDGAGLNTGAAGSIEALEYLTNLMWRDGTSPRSEVASATPAGDLFETGRLAMFLDGSWWMPRYSANITEFEWGVLPLPKGPCGTFTGYWVDAYAIPSTADDTDASFRFVRHLVGDEASNMYVDNGLFGIPGKISVAEERAEDLFRPLSEEEVDVWLDSANYGVTPSYTANWNEVWDTTNKILQRVELGELTAAEAGRLMVEEAERLIARSR